MERETKMFENNVKFVKCLIFHFACKQQIGIILKFHRNFTLGFLRHNILIFTNSLKFYKFNNTSLTQ